MNRQQAIELARKIHDLRAKRVQDANGKLSYHTLLRLKEMDVLKRQDMMARLVREGYAPDVETIERMMRSKAVVGVICGGGVSQSHRMSDDILDPKTHY